PILVGPHAVRPDVRLVARTPVTQPVGGARRLPDAAAPRRSATGLALLTVWAVVLAAAPSALALRDPDRLWQVGSGTFADKLYPTARQTLEHLVARYPDDPRVPDAWLLLGKARLAQNDLGPALEAFRRAQKFRPVPGRSQEAKFWEAETLARLGQAARALTVFLEHHAAHPDAADARPLLGVARLAQGATRAGMADLRAFATANPTHELVHAARLKIAEGERREALGRAQAA